MILSQQDSQAGSILPKTYRWPLTDRRGAMPDKAGTKTGTAASGTAPPDV
jgi:hypothetical protein